MSDELWTNFQKWKKEQDQFGKQAFARFMMLNFLDGLERISDEFVFKGGNLLWHYIKTPRETTDLDLSTITIQSHDEVRACIESSFELHEGVEFTVKDFTEVKKEDALGARAIIHFKTSRGQKNQFQLDIVYALPTDLAKVKSTTANSEYRAASIENIIADKMDAAHRFGSGNTRLKDFDDLWRISKSDIQVNSSKLRELFSERKLNFELSLSWSETMTEAWKAHSRRYKGIPSSIEKVFNEINNWLEAIK
jgi:hypothetical protein